MYDVGAKAVGPSPRVGVSEGRRAEAQTKKGIKEEHTITNIVRLAESQSEKRALVHAPP